ncbi:tyrosine-type recombinase/integrase [Nocardioides guangzhouensis]|uniref:tyrosine-type recombinase/integrase n=1 Tax=Nocardioides guangzhouensis TaxID=2497878 RepID=UPI0014385530|nr:tyrosine-type recombinase/integrase [Nocardioides guangzhouensis]
MSVQRYVKAGRVRYRARVKHHGREVATQVFDRKNDALIWEQEQTRRLRLGEWIDPRRGRVPLRTVADDWFASRHSVKRKTREADRAAWGSRIEARFGDAPVASITPAEIANWVGGLVSGGISPSTASRYLATLRSILAYAVADGRVSQNAAASVRAPTAGHVRREGQFLTRDELDALSTACRGVYADVVRVLGLAGLRWGELAGLQVGDRIAVPGPGFRLQRSVLASSKGGELFVDTLKGKRSRTVPLVAELVPLVDAWTHDKQGSDWLFGAPRGGPLGEANWKRAVGWTAACQAIGRPTFRVHDLRHTCASLWLGAGADPKVVQRILGHASAAMTMDLYGHLIDHNLWAAAEKLGGTTGAPTPVKGENDKNADEASGL